MPLLGAGSDRMTRCHPMYHIRHLLISAGSRRYLLNENDTIDIGIFSFVILSFSPQYDLAGYVSWHCK